jgi:hypothetical protein
MHLATNGEEGWPKYTAIRAPQSRDTLRDSDPPSSRNVALIVIVWSHSNASHPLRLLALGREIPSHLRFRYKPIIKIVAVLSSTQFVHFVRSLANPLLNLVWRLNHLGFCKKD